jgi:UDP-N-acetyl-D-mannosaminuronic acid dehydrogenase
MGVRRITVGFGGRHLMSQDQHDIAIIGLGYVGLTLATVCAEVGMDVLGVEVRPEVVELINAGRPHFTETGLDAALARVVGDGRLKASTGLEPDRPAEVYVITVGTPLDQYGRARIDMIEAATRDVARNMPDGALVILRSTVKVRTSATVVAPILRASGKSFDLAMCPERTLGGKALRELRELPQIVGGLTQQARDRAAVLFARLTPAIVPVANLETAEIVKLVDNTYRDVQFAFANEVARVCEAFGVQAQEVIAAGKKGYSRTNVPLPGPVGGPCLEKDPHILAESARSRGIELEITRAARLVNERQPSETAAFILAELDRRGFGPDAEVALLGIAFKGIPATDDLRGSMPLRILDAVEQARPGLRIRLFDPVIGADDLARRVPGHATPPDLETAVRGAAVTIIANNHPDLGQRDPVALAALMCPGGFTYDYWNHFGALPPDRRGTDYFGVGNIPDPTPPQSAEIIPAGRARAALSS